jgi:hypothetical protein
MAAFRLGPQRLTFLPAVPLAWAVLLVFHPARIPPTSTGAFGTSRPAGWSSTSARCSSSACSGLLGTR